MTDAIRLEQFLWAHERCSGEVSIRAGAGLLIEASCSGCGEITRAETMPATVPVDLLPVAELEQGCSLEIRSYSRGFELLEVLRNTCLHTLTVSRQRLDESAWSRLRDQLENVYQAHRRLVLTLVRDATAALGEDGLLMETGPAHQDDAEGQQWLKRREVDFQPRPGADEDPNDAAP
jgi:hypothetical protein